MSLQSDSIEHDNATVYAHGYHGLNVTITMNKGLDDELTCTGYKKNVCKEFVYGLLVLLSGFTILLISHWKPVWRLKLRCSKCSLSNATCLLLQDALGEPFVVNVCRKYTEPGMIDPLYRCVDDGSSSEQAHDMKSALLARNNGRVTNDYFRYFDFQHVRYVWDPNLMYFIKLVGVEDLTSSDKLSAGLTEDEAKVAYLLYGANIIHVEVKSYWKLFITEIVNPFYIFQIASMILWMLDEYVFYASCIIIISAISIVISLYETRKQSETLSAMVESHKDVRVTVRRRGSAPLEMDAAHLVPGDVMLISPAGAGGCVMPCDALLLTGNCIVNEAMLTGESVPVTKTAMPVHSDAGTVMYDVNEHRRHTLFCGTNVIQTRYYDSGQVTALVCRTGFSTAKGELVRSILYPKPVGFKFYEDAIRFIMFLACVAAVGMSYSIYVLYMEGSTWRHIVLRSLDIITIVVPPALPAAMTVGIIYAQQRLKQQQIYCISPPRINVAGKLKLVCFDKTGTLTEEGLDVWGVIPVGDGMLGDVVHDPSDMARGHLLTCMASCHSLTIINNEICGDPLDINMFNATKWLLTEPSAGVAAAAGSAAVGADSGNYDLLAPTTVKPVTTDTYIDVDEERQLPFEVGILHQFPFSSGLQRMSVVTRTLGHRHMDLYCKGAPERILQLCSQHSVPANFSKVLHSYTKQGFRVIALAHGRLPHKVAWHQLHKLNREELERDLTMLGLLVMQNTLKVETSPVIRELTAANIRSVMVTGDNLLTAVSVARDCGMVSPADHILLVEGDVRDSGVDGGDRVATVTWQSVDDVASTGRDSVASHHPQHTFRQEPYEDDKQWDGTQSTGYQSVTVDATCRKQHIAITGKSFAIIRQYYPDLLDKIVVGGTIFARMSPEQKSQLVESYQSLGYCVAMCGDGANDCGALKAAHVGISLSEAEASVASPFTSKRANIECVPAVIREGRCALVTSFGLFKYMSLYSMIQFITVLMLYSRDSNLGDIMFLYIDLVITTTVALLMGYTAAHPTLARKRPSASLMGAGNLLSIVIQIIIQLTVQILAFYYLLQQSWYVRVVDTGGGENVIDKFETSVLFCVSAYQYLILSYCFSIGRPYRKPIYTNVPFLLTLIVLSLTTTAILLHPAVAWIQPFDRWIQLNLDLFTNDKFIFRVTLLLLAGVNLILSSLVEAFVVNSRVVKRVFHKLCCKRQPKNKYHVVERQMGEDEAWPPLGQVISKPVL